MKKLIYLLTTILLLGTFYGGYAQSDKMNNREIEKVCKKRTKELTKQGWTISGTSLTLEAAFLKFMRTTNSGENKELIVDVSMCKSINVCKSIAFNNALVDYASTASSFVLGRATSEMFNNSSAAVPEEFDKFFASYERLVQGEIRGELEFSFAIEKPNGAGRAYSAYYIINEEKASKARLRAFKRAAEEANIEQLYTGQIENFVREGFEFK